MNTGLSVRQSVLQDDTDKKTQQVVELFRGIETYAGKVHDL